MSPKPRRAHHEEMPLTTTITAAVATTAMTASSDSMKEDIKNEDVLEADAINMQENEDFLEETTEILEGVPQQPIPDGDADKSAGECTNTTEPLNEEEPSIASQLMSSETEGDSLSMEGIVMSEDEREAVCDKTMEQV